MNKHTASSATWVIDAAGVAACFALIGLWYIGGVRPLSRAKDTRVSLQAQLADRRENQQKLDASKQEQEQRLAELRGEIRAVKISLLGVEEMNHRLQELTRLALASDLRLDEIKPGTPVGLEHYTAVPIRVAGQGGYQASARFFHELHAGFKEVGITGFELRGEPEATDKPATFVVHLLWYARAAEPGRPPLGARP